MNVDAFTPYRGARTQVRDAGVSVTAIYAPVAAGFIQNPLTVAEQTLPFYVTEPESLWVSLTGPATMDSESIELEPGDIFEIPEGTTEPVWVVAATAGHTFTAVAIQPAVLPPVILPNVFPPSGPTSLQKTIKAYPYNEYNDDDDVLGWFQAYNDYTQLFVDWFNQVELPVYTGLSGSLLDWVARGLYGQLRPTLNFDQRVYIGPLNTYAPGANPAPATTLVDDILAPSNVATDDIFKRIITWHCYRGDGRNITAEWIKRRVNRFLNGAAGTDAIGDTRQISVLFAENDALTITIVIGHAKLDRFNCSACGSFAPGHLAPMSYAGTTTGLPTPALASVLKEGIECGALEMPIGYKVTVRIGVMGDT